ncbi:hypothetical protein C8R47DRAFT_970191 [Mycena vitilis]|nr:hypothetical protein C8R47DRAFT_970191 [Mycena vitilis]
MHQTHNIAWDSLIANLVFIFENPSITPRRTDLFPRNLASQSKSLSHFARTVATTIRAFSDTERAKYPARYNAPLQGQLFPDIIISRYSGLSPSVTPKTQLVENWIERACTTPASRRDLADVVKVLLGENQLEPLLMLAQHPHVPLTDLHSVTWAGRIGWDRSMHRALDAYIFFNVLLSTPESHADSRYKLMPAYARVTRKLENPDYYNETFPHCQFFCGSLHGGIPDGFDPLGDADKLHEYLKACFRLVYRYDMLARECGRSVDLEGSVVCAVSELWRVPVDNIERGQDWIVRFA